MNIDMAPSITLVLTAAFLVAIGVYMVTERSLSRILIGIIILGNGVNLMFLVAGGSAGGPPIVGTTEKSEMSDPLPQAMVLTAIVITMGISAFLLAMAYRSWQLHRHDEVQDDIEDRRIARLAARDERAFQDSDTDASAPDLDDDAAETRDETDDSDVVESGASVVNAPPDPSAESVESSTTTGKESA